MGQKYFSWITLTLALILHRNWGVWKPKTEDRRPKTEDRRLKKNLGVERNSSLRSSVFDLRFPNTLHNCLFCELFRPIISTYFKYNKDSFGIVWTYFIQIADYFGNTVFFVRLFVCFSCLFVSGFFDRERERDLERAEGVPTII